MNKIGIVVPVLNNFKGLCEALESVRTSHIWTPYIIPNWRINQCVSWAWNDGTRHAIADGCDYILIINDDILFGPHTIDVLVDHLDNHPECVMATACNIQEELPDPYAIFTYEADKPELISPHPDFSCFMVRPDIFEKIGTFDENFKPAYFEDNDYHRRIQLAGLEAQSTTKAPYYHIGSVTQQNKGDDPGRHASFESNRMYYRDKWGGQPGYETFTVPFNDPNKTWKDW